MPCETVLTYSRLPPNSDIEFDVGDTDFVVTILPAPFWYTVVIASAVLMGLAVITFGALAWTADLSHARSLFGEYPLKATLTLLGLAAFWAAAIKLVRQAFARREMPTVLRVSGGQLIVVTPEQDRLQHIFTAGSDLKLRVVSLGLGTHLHWVGELRIRQGSKKLSVLHGRGLREVEWVSKVLSAAVNAPPGALRETLRTAGVE